MQEKDFNSKIERLLNVIDKQEVMINDLKKTVLVQAEKIKALELDILILKKGKNSQNSSKPPSSDMNVKRSLRKAGEKKSGGQPGHTLGNF